MQGDFDHKFRRVEQEGAAEKQLVKLDRIEIDNLKQRMVEAEK